MKQGTTPKLSQLGSKTVSSPKLKVYKLPGLLNYGLLILAIGSYLALSYFAPKAAQNSSIHLTHLQVILLVVSIALPYFLTWTLAVHGLTVLGRYIRAFGAKDNELIPVLAAIYRGLGWIVWGLIATALLGSTQNFFPQYKPMFTIAINYFYVLPSLIGFWLMYKGLSQLLGLQKFQSFRLHSDTVIKTLLVGILMAAYVFLVFTNPNRQLAVNATTPASYYLPDPLIALTIIVPVFATWWLGFSVAFMISDLIPRFARAEFFQAMNRILYGIWAIIFTSILIQALLSLGTTRLLSIGLGLLLVLVYIFLLLDGLGYLLVVLGVRKLRKAVKITT